MNLPSSKLIKLWKTFTMKGADSEASCFNLERVAVSTLTTLNA